MHKETIGGYAVEIDRTATENWYAQAQLWDCTCAHCSNFLKAAKKRLLPESILAALDALGLPPEKATYVGELYTDETGTHNQFSYRICGNILVSPAEQTDMRCCHEPYPYSAPGFPAPHFDAEFYAVLPWIDENA